MPKISKAKKERISEQILAYLFTCSPKSIYTSKVANEIIRDEEFTKSLLKDLEKKSFVTKVTKSSTGTVYIKRERWRLSNKTYDIYKQHAYNNSFKKDSL